MRINSALLKAILVVAAFVSVFALIITTRHFTQGNAGAVSVVAVATFPAKHQSWMTANVLPPNIIAHWREYSHLGLTLSASDPGVGVTTLEDHWEATGNNSVLLWYHNIYTLPNGALYQETYGDATTTIIVRGPAYFATDGNTSNAFWCVSQSGPQTGIGNYPPSVLPSRLRQYSFAQASATLAKPVPVVSSLTGITTQPVQVLPVPASVTAWQGIGLPPNGQGRETLVLDTDAQQRVIVSDMRYFDTAGTLQYEEWYSISAVTLYPGDATLPAWVQTEPQQVTQGCSA